MGNNYEMFKLRDRCTDNRDVNFYTSHNYIYLIYICIYI